MPRLTSAQKESLRIIRTLTKLCAADSKARRTAARDVARAEKIAAAATKPPPRPRHLTVALTRYGLMRDQLASAQVAMSSDPKGNAFTAGVFLNANTTAFANHINYYADVLADEMSPELISWAAAYCVPTRRAPCPLPNLHMNQTQEYTHAEAR